MGKGAERGTWTGTGKDLLGVWYSCCFLNIALLSETRFQKGEALDTFMGWTACRRLSLSAVRKGPEVLGYWLDNFVLDSLLVSTLYSCAVRLLPYHLHRSLFMGGSDMWEIFSLLWL